MLLSRSLRFGAGFLLVMCLAALLGSGVFAQAPAGRPAGAPAGAPTGGQQPPANFSGEIKGIVLDETTDEGIGFSTIELLRARDSSVVGGALTDSTGRFSIKKVTMGAYKLRIRLVSRTLVSKAMYYVSPRQPVADAGTIRINPSATQLADVVIEARREEVQVTADRKIYSLEGNLVTVGGSASDALQNIPSVTVDVDGNVALRGSENVTIWIDGKPSGLSGANRAAILQQLPANLIDRIEVITNPSARFDAEGEAGIINIITKKGALVGTNGNVTAGIGTNDKYNAAFLLNKRGVKYNLTLNYSYRRENRFLRSDAAQKTFRPDTTFYYDTNSDGFTNSTFQSFRAGFDYMPTKFQTIGLSAAYSNRRGAYGEDVRYTYFNQDFVLDREFFRRNSTGDQNHNWDFSLDYKRTYPDSKRELSAMANLSYNPSNDSNRFNSGDGLDVLAPYLRNGNNTKFTTGTAQVDYVHPFGQRNQKLETGGKYTLRRNDRSQDASRYDFLSDVFVPDVRNIDHFIYTENVAAAYAIYSGQFNPKLAYNVGLRGEQTYTIAESQSMGTTTTRSYFSLFPSVFLQYVPKEGTSWNVSYSRRVTRPRIMMINPFVDYSDSLNTRQGNPDIQPEFTNAMEFGYSQTFTKFTLNFSTYYRMTENSASMYRTVDPNTGVSVMTFRNFAKSQSLGLESMIRYRLGRLSNIIWSFNGFWSKVDASNVQGGLTNETFSWNTRLSAQLNLAKNTNLQLTGMYMGPIVLAQGTLQGFSGLDVALRQEFLNKRLGVTFNVSDVFFTRYFRSSSEGIAFSQSNTRRRESRIAMLTITYRFGSFENNQQQQRRRRPDMGMEQGGGDGGFVDQF